MYITKKETKVSFLYRGKIPFTQNYLHTRIEKLNQLPKDFNKPSFDDKNYKIKNGESFNNVDERFIDFINDLLNQNNESYALFIHGLILLSYLETICNFKFDGINFDIRYNNKVIINENPKSPSVYKIIYNDNNDIIDISIVYMN